MPISVLGLIAVSPNLDENESVEEEDKEWAVFSRNPMETERVSLPSERLFGASSASTRNSVSSSVCLEFSLWLDFVKASRSARPIENETFLSTPLPMIFHCSPSVPMIGSWSG
jgi:hypothetical protein